MKKLLSLLVFVFALCFSAKTQIVINGKASGHDKEIYVSYWDRLKLHMDTIQLDRNRSFKLNRDATDPIFLRFAFTDPNYATPFLVFFPGDTVQIEKTNDSFSIKGGVAEYNRFQINFTKEMNSQISMLSSYNQKTEFALTEFDRFFAGYQHKNAAILKTLSDQAIVINYKLYPLLTRYNSQETVMQRVEDYFKNRETAAAGDTLLTYLERINPNNVDFALSRSIDISMFNNFIRILRMLKLQNDSLLEQVDPYVIERSIIRDMLRPGYFRTMLLGFNLHMRIEQFTEYAQRLSSISEFVDDYKTEPGNERFLKQVEETYAAKIRNINVLAKGSLAPVFNLPDARGRMVSLADFKNKVVYIDLWATWCGPCLKEMPFLAKLREKFSGTDLQIVSISLDTNKDLWLKKIADLKLGGLQLIDSKGSLNSKTGIDYQVYGVPRFILIDKKGRVVNASAPPPSDPQIEKPINQLL